MIELQCIEFDAVPPNRWMELAGRWRKRKGVADVKFEDGTMRVAEVHWHEATGIRRKELKIKYFID